MKRHALIISNPGEYGAENYCEGVKVDVQNYTAFLKSPLGGGWYDSEISHLDRPFCVNLEKSISDLSSYEYTFFVFCGHGFYSAQRESTILELRKGQEFNSIDLRKNSNKRSILLDCCRKVEKEIITEAALVAKFAEAREMLNMAECRRYFEKQVDNCTKGVIVGYACSKNETAGDNQTKGGYYSHSILKAATSWRETHKIDLTKSWSAFSVVSSHDGAIPNVKRMSGGTQNPEIEKPRTDQYFPFAIMA